MKDGITVGKPCLVEEAAEATFNVTASASYLPLEGKAATLPTSHTTVPAQPREEPEEELLLCQMPPAYNGWH